MCLIVDKTRTSTFKRRHKNSGNKKIVIYKVLKTHYYDAWSGIKSPRLSPITPYEHTVVSTGLLKAEGKPYFDEDGDLHEGTIHCYRKKEFAEENLSEQESVLICWAYVKDFIACSENEIAFKKIHIPKSELERVMK